jgi:hypothetical protein
MYSTTNKAATRVGFSNSFHEDYASTADRNCYNREEYFKPGRGLIALKVFAQRPVVIQIGKFVFSHADIGSFLYFADENKWKDKYFRFCDSAYEELHQLNNHVFTYLNGVVVDDATKRKIGFVFNDGPLWDRQICQYGGNDDIKKKNTSLKFISAHTVQVDSASITEKIHGKAWCVDTGMSDAFNTKGKTYDTYHREHAQSLQIINIKSHNPTITIINAFNVKPRNWSLKVTFTFSDKSKNYEVVQNNINTVSVFGRRFQKYFGKNIEPNYISGTHFELEAKYPDIFITDVSTYGTLISQDCISIDGFDRSLLETTQTITRLNKNERTQVPKNYCIILQHGIVGRLEWLEV